LDLTGGGAFYSQTPESCLEDLGVNEGVNEASLVREVSRSDGGLENTLCHSEQSEESQSRANIVSKKILNYPTSTLPCNARPSQTRGAEVQDDCLSFLSNGRGGKKPAFTLAEILVTLGVIGIISAMTLPMLAKNYNFYIRQQQFKKAYAALEIAVQKTQIDMGEGVRCFYLNNSWIEDNMKGCSYFYSELTKNLQLLKVCEGNALRDGCIPKNIRGLEEVYKDSTGESLPSAQVSGCHGFLQNQIYNSATAYVFNSFVVIPYYGHSNEFRQMAVFLIDINSHKGPNKWGHDIFLLQFDKKKETDSVFKIEPCIRCHPIDKGGYYTKTFIEYLYGRNAEL